MLQARVKNQVGLFLQKLELQRLAWADGLTGLANRKHFNEALDNALRRIQRSGEYLAFALIDIDHFKQHNDHYGHMQGDDALRLVAQTMRQHAQRAGDLAERYGVGEFAFVSLGDKNTLPQLVENFRLAIQTLAVEHAAASSGILTVSAGVIVCNPQHNISSEQLLGTTDQLLYQAKAGGPNRVVQQVLE